MVRGSCLCGGVRFEIERVVGPFELCHCSRCRKVSGSAFMAGVVVESEGFRLLQGSELISTYDAPLLESPPPYRSFFCRRCGSPTPDPTPSGRFFEIAAGLLDEDPGRRPDKHIFVDFKSPWYDIRDLLPRFTKEQIVRARVAAAPGQREAAVAADEPLASRPYMPGYGILDAASGRGLLPWRWAVKRLGQAHNYWVSTARADGRPHAAAVWGVWLDEAFHFSTGAESRKARNLALNPSCVVTTDRADEAVVLEGVASKTTDADLLSRVCELYNAKYSWNMDPSQGPFFAVRPRRAFGFIETAGEFATSATRWIFPEA